MSDFDFCSRYTQSENAIGAPCLRCGGILGPHLYADVASKCKRKQNRRRWHPHVAKRPAAERISPEALARRVDPVFGHLYRRGAPRLSRSQLRRLHGRAGSRRSSLQTRRLFNVQRNALQGNPRLVGLGRAKSRGGRRRHSRPAGALPDSVRPAQARAPKTAVLAPSRAPRHFGAYFYTAARRRVRVWPSKPIP